MKKLFLFTLLFNYLSLSANFLSKCEFIELENLVHNWQKKAKYLCHILSKFELYLTRKQDLLNERDIFFNDFLEYINCLSANNEMCIISAKYRLFKWLYIVSKKNKITFQDLEKEHCQFLTDFVNANLETKLHCLQMNLIMLEKIDCNLCVDRLINDIENLIKKIIKLIDSFKELTNWSSDLKNEILNQKKHLQDYRLSMNLNCCCWL